jgi:hypothetical protein
MIKTGIWLAKSVVNNSENKVCCFGYCKVAPFFLSVLNFPFPLKFNATSAALSCAREVLLQRSDGACLGQHCDCSRESERFLILCELIAGHG